MDNHLTAGIERGKIISVEAGGCIVASIDRDGIESPPLEALYSDGTIYSVGDCVYFFMFNDGTGRILGKFTI